MKNIQKQSALLIILSFCYILVGCQPMVEPLGRCRLTEIQYQGGDRQQFTYEEGKGIVKKNSTYFGGFNITYLWENGKVVEERQANANTTNHYFYTWIDENNARVDYRLFSNGQMGKITSYELYKLKDGLVQEREYWSNVTSTNFVLDSKTIYAWENYNLTSESDYNSKNKLRSKTTYTYDDKRNPDREVFFGMPVYPVSQNNKTKELYQNFNTSTGAIISSYENVYQYTYNKKNYPIKSVVYEVSDPSDSYEQNYFYDKCN